MAGGGRFVNGLCCFALLLKLITTQPHNVVASFNFSLSKDVALFAPLQFCCQIVIEWALSRTLPCDLVF